MIFATANMAVLMRACVYGSPSTGLCYVNVYAYVHVDVYVCIPACI